MTKTFAIVRAAATALVVAGFIAAVPAAQAATEDTAPTAEIDVSKVDFNSPAAVSHLITRAHRVAMDVCTDNAHVERGMNQDQRACVTAALKISLAQIETRRQEAMRATTVHMAAAQTDPAPAH